ncbi:MAG: hypothetical protein Q8R04_02560 [Nanoarchaeota archaeon]|nr:hypothetical protein [Nanoarchaeota archaeon]
MGTDDMDEFERVSGDIHTFFDRNPELELILREALRGPDILENFASLDQGLRARISNFGERLKLAHPDIRKGYDAGSRAEKPPVDLEDVVKYQRIFEETFTLGEDIGTNAGFALQGYSTGLEFYMSQRGVPNFSVLGRIAKVDGFVRFISGLEMSHPKIERKSLYDFRLADGEIDYDASTRYTSIQEAYKMGFKVAMAKKYGFIARDEQIPIDSISYVAFRRGLVAECVSLPAKENTKLELFDIQFQTLDENAYQLGIEVWLRSQNIKDVNVEQIRNPEALKAFKAALSGEVLPQYEKGLASRGLATARELAKPILHQPQSPQNLAYNIGYAAYLLGKRARQAR